MCSDLPLMIDARADGLVLVLPCTGCTATQAMGPLCVKPSRGGIRSCPCLSGPTRPSRRRDALDLSVGIFTAFAPFGGRVRLA